MAPPLQEQVSVFWKKQSGSQRITIIVLLAALLIVVPVLINWASQPSYTAAFSGLSEDDAGQIVQKLDEQGVDYKLQSTGTILVPSEKVYEVRLSMAREGLPESSTVGYELFSGNTLGMTEFTQRVNYQRAIEGELERTIGSMEVIDAVRVHVVTPEKALLTQAQAPATASVTIRVKPGSSVNQAQVRAITNLVASSVEDLEPANVVVVDTEGMLLAGGQEEGTEGAAGQTDNQRAAEVQAAAEVRSKVQSILDQVLGPNRAIVQASVAMDWNQKEIISSSFEPTPSAIRSSYKVDESYESNGDTAGDVPGAETNLPETAEGQALAAIEGGASTYNRSEETINYEISQTETHETIAPGQIKQLSLSVMVDGVEDQGQLDAIKAAAAAAAGIDETRGDMIVVESMAFDRSYYEAQAADLEASSQQDLYMQIGIAVAAALALIGLMVYFQRTLQKARRGSTAEWRPVLRPVAEMALQQAQQAGLPDAGNKRLPSQKSRELPKKTDEELLAEISNRSGNGDFPQDEQRARIINRLSEENPATVAEIIQIWLSEDDRKNS